jgi:hypothetical protein
MVDDRCLLTARQLTQAEGGDSDGSTSGSSGIVGGSGAVPGSCSGIVPGSAGIGSSGVGRSGVGTGSCVAIRSSSLVGDPFTRFAMHKTVNGSGPPSTELERLRKGGGGLSVGAEGSRSAFLSFRDTGAGTRYCA